MIIYKSIPRNIDECRTVDPVSSKLERWAAWIVGVAVVLGLVLILIGLWFLIDEEDLVISFGCLGGAFVIIGSACVLSLLIRALACIVYNTHVSANVALMNANVNVNAEESKQGEAPKANVDSVFGAVPQKNETKQTYRHTSAETSKLLDELMSE